MQREVFNVKCEGARNDNYNWKICGEHPDCLPKCYDRENIIKNALSSTGTRKLEHFQEYQNF